MLKPLTFVISAENHPDPLARTVMVLHRLAIPIQALQMECPESSRRMRITVEVLANPDQSERIAENLAKIVHVVWVQARRELRRPKRNARYALVRNFR
jgi:acetolactate synthase small subunit